MPDGQVLEFSGVSKRFGAVSAVSDLSARIEPAMVTGFLGPNGAGKTTSLRILLGLVRADAGTATIGGVRYADLAHPLQSVGAVLEASSFHPGRSAANHLKVYAQAAGLPMARVDEALGTVGLAEVAGRKVGGFSLGMRQRLGLAYALLGDPAVLVLDEPANGLDPEGIKWMRGLLRQLARQGRTVLVSSHLLAEVQQTVDALLILSQGRLVFQGRLDELTDPSEYVTVVDSPDRAGLVEALRTAGMDYEVLRSGLTVRAVDTVQVGALAAGAGVALSTLQRRGPGLEEVFLDLVNGTRVHGSTTSGLASAAAAVPESVEADAVPEAVEAVEAVADASDAAVASAASDAVEPDPAEPEVDAPTTPEAEAAEAWAPIPAVGDAGDGDARETTTTDAPDAEPLQSSEEGPATHAAFAVAATGVIEVVPDEATPSPDEEPPDAVTSSVVDEVPAEADASTDEDVPADRVWAMPAAESHDAPADDLETAEESDAADEEGPAAEEPAVWTWPADGASVEAPEEVPEEEVAADAATAGDADTAAAEDLESDRDADRFFAAFDAPDTADEPPTGDDPAPDIDDAEPDTEIDEGGEPR